jgi:CRISPR/Cas system CSM-associated protein Csm2 small subunit
MAEAFNIEAEQNKLNNLVEDWTRATTSKMKALLASAPISDQSTGQAARRTSAAVKKKNNEAERIAFKIPRYVVFFTKGVGRGRGINSGKTKPNPAFNQVLDEEIPKLSQLITDNFQDRIINATNAYIK